MPSSAFRIDSYFGDAARPGGHEISQAPSATPHIEHQLNSPGDIGRAHQFFQPAQPAQAIGHAAVAPPGSDLSSLTAKALAAAQQQISPIIQLIMRMPGHIGVMSSVFEAFSNFFMGHADLLGHFDPHILAMHGADASQHLDAAKDLLRAEHMHVDVSLLPHDAPILHDAGFESVDLGGAASEHSFDLSYVNEHLFNNSDLNVSGTLDGAKSQFDGLSFTDPHGEIISGPSLSQASPATHLTSGHRVFLEQGMAHGNSMGGAAAQGLASHAQSAPSVAAAMPQGLPPSSLNVGASAFGTPSSALPAVAGGNQAAGLGANVSDGGSLSGLSSASEPGSLATGGNPISSHQTIALNKTAVPEGLSKQGFGTNEYGAKYINEQPSGSGDSLLKGMKAKELTLGDSLKNHNLADATTPHTPAANHPASHHGGETLKHAAHKNMAESVKHHAGSKHLSSKSSSPSSKTTAGPKATEADAQGAPGNNANDGATQATQSNAEEIADNASATDATKASEQSETVSYTVKEGDCLWDIAQEHLGDGSKWQEIYKLNTDVIGENPDLIHTGATIQLPGSDHLAVADAGEAAKYVVKSGDNLWDIAKHNLGEGTKWNDVYKLNHELIGENPNLIYPGQEINLGAPHAAGDSATLADASGAPQAPHAADAPADAPADAQASAATPATEQVAQAPAAPTVQPSAFGTPNEPTAALPEFGSPDTHSAVAHHAPVATHGVQPDPHNFPAGAATAAPTESVAPSTQPTPTTDAGPGAAGAATLPEFGAGPGPVSPDKSSLVSSSLLTSLQNFITQKK